MNETILPGNSRLICTYTNSICIKSALHTKLMSKKRTKQSNLHESPTKADIGLVFKDLVFFSSNELFILVFKDKANKIAFVYNPFQIKR